MTTGLQKIPSGIPGFDQISDGGMPCGGHTLISGTSGSGKTIFSAQFLYQGIMDRSENGVFVTFEEWPADIIRDVRGFGWDIPALESENKWAFVDASPDEAEGIELGHYNLEALLARVEYAINKVKAKRVVIDSISSIFFHYHDIGIIRRELYRLICRLKKMNITTLMTAERETEEGAVSRFGVEQFVLDNVLLLHNRLNDTGKRERTIEILKFRGSDHTSGEVPLLINSSGMSIYPWPNVETHGRASLQTVSLQKTSTGISGLDEMLYDGVYQNSITFLSGASGTGKTIASLHFILEGARKGEQSLLIEFEEGMDQLCANAQSFGWELKEYVQQGLVQIMPQYEKDAPPEQYLRVIQEIIDRHQVKRLVIDTISCLQQDYSEDRFRGFLTGLCDFLRAKGVTALLCSNTGYVLGGEKPGELNIPLTADNIILLRYVELGGRIRRFLNVLKQRGCRHMKELMEFEITSRGVEIVGVFEGVENLIGGSARRVRIRFDEEDAEREFMEEVRRGRV